MKKITLTVSEVAELLGVSSMTIYTMCKNGEIKHSRVRGRILFHLPTIEEWLINGGTKENEKVENRKAVSK